MSDENEVYQVSRFTLDYDDAWSKTFVKCLVHKTRHTSEHVYRPEFIFVFCNGFDIMSRMYSLKELDDTIKLLKDARKVFAAEYALYKKLQRSMNKENVTY
jgi:phosphoribosylformylglycinamidine (FGAM) synthase-like amidotransferase family enzyme